MAALEMAKSSLGAALVPQFLAAREIELGRAALWHGMNMPSGRTYNLYYKKSRHREPAIQALIHWFKGQIGLKSVIRPAPIQKWRSLEMLAR
jgi:LysR family glycine cleavage system transcriptional activator